MLETAGRGGRSCLAVAHVLDPLVDGGIEMAEHFERTSRFLALHQGEQPLLLPNPWDRGSAVLLAWLGFQALATTRSGSAATLGRSDGSVTREEACGCRLFGHSCDLRILMDQSTESISPHDPPSRHDDNWFAGPEWRCLSQGAVRTVAVVMVDELS